MGGILFSRNVRSHYLKNSQFENNTGNTLADIYIDTYNLYMHFLLRSP
jgi:hypothetical protein